MGGADPFSRVSTLSRPSPPLDFYPKKFIIIISCINQGYLINFIQQVPSDFGPTRPSISYGVHALQLKNSEPEIHAPREIPLAKLPFSTITVTNETSQKPQIITDMISISSGNLGGGDNLRYLREKEARIFGVNETNSSGQKVRI